MLLVLALACLYVGAEGLLAIRPAAAEFSGLAETDAPANGGTKKKSCGKRKKRLTPHRRYGIVSITYERRAFFLCAFFAFYAQRGEGFVCREAEGTRGERAANNKEVPLDAR